MDVEVGGHGALHLVEEGAELARPVPLHAAPDDRAGGGVEGGEQGGRAVALVIMAAPLRLARPHRQHRLGAVQRLDLALFVDAEHQRAVRRVEIEADDVAHLVDELRIARQLEALDAVRLQAEGAPDAVHRRRRDARRPGHRAAAPVGRIVGRRLQRPRHHFGDLVVADPARRAAPRLIVEAADAFLGKAAAPQADGPSRDAQLLRDRRVAQPVRRQQHDPRPPRRPVRRLAAPNPPLKLNPLPIAQNNRNRLAARHHCLQIGDPGRKESQNKTIG